MVQKTTETIELMLTLLQTSSFKLTSSLPAESPRGNHRPQTTVNDVPIRIVFLWTDSIRDCVQRSFIKALLVCISHLLL